MAAQSPIARFFVPAQKAAKERAEQASLTSMANSPPQTPGPRAPSALVFFEGNQVFRSRVFWVFFPLSPHIPQA